LLRPTDSFFVTLHPVGFCVPPTQLRAQQRPERKPGLTSHNAQLNVITTIGSVGSSKSPSNDISHIRLMRIMRKAALSMLSELLCLPILGPPAPPAPEPLVPAELPEEVEPKWGK
ncbi:hypothetical protein TYRP_016420, partial [Tyrophagus putrescentiae]